MPVQAALTPFSGVTVASTADLDANLTSASMGGMGYGAISGGSGNSQTITIPLVLTHLVDGLLVSFIAGFGNTGPATLNINGLGVRNLCAATGALLSSGQIVAGTLYTFRLVTVASNQHLRLA